LQSGQRHVVSRLGRLFAWGVGAVVLLLGVAFAYAQTPIAKEQISRVLSEQLSEPPNRTEISGLQGLLPFDVRIGRISVADEEGEWLRVDEARLELDPADLVAGRLRARQLGAERVELERLPETGAAPSTGPAIPALPALPDQFPPVSVDRVYVNEIQLGAPVLGEAARFRLDGSLLTAAEGRELTADLALQRIDRDTTSASLRAALDLGARTLSLEAEVRDDGRLVGALSGRPDAGPLRFTLNGRGPLEHFAATLDLDAENLARLEAELNISRSDLLRLAFDGRFRAAPGVLPPAYAGLIGETATLAFELVQSDAERITMPRLEVRSGLLELEGRGEVALDRNRIDGEVTARIADLSRASAVVGRELGGSLSVTARPRTEGPGAAVVLEVAGRALRLDRFETASLDGRITLAPLAPLDRGFTGVTAEGKLAFGDLAEGGEPLEALQDLTLVLAGDWRREGTLELGELALTAAALDLRTSGSLDTAAGSGRLEITAGTRGLGELLALALPDSRPLASVSGGLDAKASLTLADGFRRLDGSTAISGRNLTGLPAGTSQLLGPAPQLRAALSMRPGGSLQIRDLVLEGADLELTGTAGITGPEQKLEGALQLAVPDLAPLSAALGRELSGDAEARVALAGSLADPAADLKLQVTPLAVDAYRLDRFALDLTAKNLRTDLSGRLRAEAAIAEQSLTLAGSFGLRGRRLDLRETTLEGPETRGTLDLGLDLDRLLASGELELEIADLAALAPWHRQELAGRLGLRLRLEARDGTQQAELQADAGGIRSAFGELDELEAETGIEDLFGTGTVRGALQLAGLRRPGLVLESARLRLAGPVSGMTVTADLSGTAVDPFEIAAEARLALSENRQELTLTDMQGLLAGQKIGLRNPAHAVLEKGVLKIDRLDLFVGKGSIRGELETGPDRQKAELTGTGLPLLLLARLADLPIRGTLDFALALDAAGAERRARLQARIGELQARDLLGTDYAPVNMELALLLDRGMLKASLVSDSADSGRSRLRLDMPVTWSALPLRIALPPDTPLEGELDARAQLALVTALLGLRDQYVTGRAEARLALSGTLSAPRLTGGLQIRDGRIEDGVSGTVLQDVLADIRAEGDRLRIARFAGRDPGKGRVELTGELRFPDLRTVDYRLGLEARGLRFWNTPLATISGKAGLTLVGDLRQASLTGDVVVQRGEIRVLARTGTRIPEIAVVEVEGDRPTIRPAAPPPSPSGGSRPFALRLDVDVDIPGRLFARGGGLDSEWEGRLQIGGTLPAPTIVGTIEARRALLDLLGRRFRLRQGRIVFSGATPPQPEIELVAYARGPDITALFHVTGPLSKPSLLLESEPPLPRDEVVARLLFGEDAGRLEPMQALQVAAILAEMEGGGLDVFGKLRDATTLDTLRISSGRDSVSGTQQGESDPADSYVAAGKYLTEDVYVEVEQSVRGDQTAVRAEVDIGAGVKVSSVVDEAGGGVELEWRYDF